MPVYNGAFTTVLAETPIYDGISAILLQEGAEGIFEPSNVSDSKVSKAWGKRLWQLQRNSRKS